MTWLDILLVMLLALVTALGVRLGLSGLLWGLGSIFTMWLLNALIPVPFVVFLLAVGVAVGLGLLSARMPLSPIHLAPQTWHSVGGGVGGFALGLVTILALSVAFPLSSAQGIATYPSTNLPIFLRQAVAGSAIQKTMAGVWAAPAGTRKLFIPDWK